MLDIRPLKDSDVPAALRLSIQAGWNQVEADWQRLIALWPNSCIAGWESGSLVAAATLAVYNQSIAWAGMILVDESRRGQGHAGTILNRILEIADEEKIACVGLDATDLGLPVYSKHGFRERTAINRWGRPAGAISNAQAVSTISDGEFGPIEGDSWEKVLKLDRIAIGVDRGGLLRHLAAEDGAATLALSRGGRVLAAGFLRTGRTASAIAPLIGESPRDAANLLHALLPRTSPDRPIFLDTLGGSAIEETLTNLGFTIQRRLVRMFRASVETTGAPLSSPRVFAGAGFELG